jgi:hypothetical protein
MRRTTVITARIALGTIALVAVWFNVVWYEESGHWPRRPEVFLFSAVTGLVLCPIGSFISVALRQRSGWHSFAFALPFVLPAGISATALFEGSYYRPFVFWASAAVVALLLAYASDYLFFRVIEHKQKDA